jgi:ATP:ADP antiporter, AAA family
MSSTFKFGKIRSFLWPIHSSELKKFIPMVLIFFLIAFNYNVLRAVKDTLIVTAQNSGAEAIPFIKVWAILPMALLMTLIYTKLSNKFSTEKVFYMMMGIFLGFFTLFTFVLYPLREIVHPNGAADSLQVFLPQGFKGLIAMIRHWSLTLFYVMAELWGTAILTVCFWGFANEVTTVHEAKRFYSLFGVGANIAGTISGEVAIFLSGKKFYEFIPYGQNAWDQSVLFMTLTVLATGVLIIGLFRYINKKAIDHSEPTISQVKQKREKISLKKSFTYLARSKYLLFIALIVLAYNLTTHIVEVVWKNQVHQLLPNPSDFNAYMGKVMVYTGLFATAVALFLSGNFLRRFSWTFSALITPLIVLFSGGLFFAFFLYKDTSAALSLASFFGSTPLIMSVIFGTMQNTLSRASKYTLFDSTKEISFIPLDKESRRKGKAAIDGVGSRFGKSFGSALTQGLLIIFSTLTACAPFIAVIFLIIISVWLLSTIALGKEFHIVTSAKEKISLKIPKPVQEIDLDKNVEKYFPFASKNEKEKVKK